ncbi:serine/threonine protein kinase [Corallococcus sp. M34]|uniref:serine/threonine-protein kinase n=1 Tax=Citreicoccus inhibens TaxID=2849499 RepID=UPI001C249B2A|nr:serine/threonine-protein kinase [Citreicoccus inhibens]MBU8895757.1 serine/threonine protein kinase [Citreicoccus inhibens]
MARPVEPEPLTGPVRFGPYTLVRRIGAGGMGEVFLAREEALGRAVVVKKVLPGLVANRQFVGRFRDEARVVVRLAHPNIARVYAMGEAEGQLYLAMEYVQGKTLSRLAYRLRQRGRMMPLGALLHLGQRLCEGLAYAHDALDETGHPLHLVHRDLSPANVCLSYAGEVKIIDFGAAQSTLKEQQTSPRVVIGNLTYMAPEQARKRFVDRRADVYAAGALLWELFAWKPLPQRGDPAERWRRAAYPQWESAGRHRPGLPRSVDVFLLRALAAEPSERFPDAAAMSAALGELKAKLAPGVGDSDLARLMGDAFPREKQLETKVLAELLREDATQSRTQQEFPAVHAPPTALAFEHSGLEAPEEFLAPADEVAQVAAKASLGSDDDAEVTQTAVAPRSPGPSGAGRDAPGMRGGVDAQGASSRSGAVGDARGHPPMRGGGVEAPGASGASGAGGDARGAVGDATEALAASQILGAIARTASASARPRATLGPRETQVGFGVDISQTLESSALEVAQRLALVRAISGADATTPAEPFRARPVWHWVALFTAACALGFGVVWLFGWLFRA